MSSNKIVYILEIYHEVPESKARCFVQVFNKYEDLEKTRQLMYIDMKRDVAKYIDYLKSLDTNLGSYVKLIEIPYEQVGLWGYTYMYTFRTTQSSIQ